jgi:prophage regulatory protein
VSHVILRLPAVKARTGLSRSSIYLRVSEGSFPAAIPLGGRAVGWIEQEIDEWVLKQIEKARRSRSPVYSEFSLQRR